MFVNSLIQFRNWLINNDCQNVCIESTEKYYIPVYNALEGFISNVVVANPKGVKCIKGEKDDNKDAKWIANLFKMGLICSSYIPSKDFKFLLIYSSSSVSVLSVNALYFKISM